MAGGKRKRKRVGERRSSRDPETGRAVSPTDIKQYVFCPLIPYYRRVLGLKPLLDSQQEESREEHEKVGKLDERRIIPLKIKEFKGSRVVRNLDLFSRKINAHGVLDLLLITPWGELIPVDYKFSKSDKGKAWIDHKYQLAFYAILVEEKFGKVVKRGIICYLPEQRAVEVRITSRMKTRVKQIIRKIIEMDEKQEPPHTRRNPDKCSGGCGYAWVCQG